MNIYCDESTHLERDGMPFLVLGAIQCPAHRARAVSRHIRKIKAKYRIPVDEELKWMKISPGNAAMYMDIVDFFLTCDDLRFRVLVAPKDGLNHERFGQTHDEWYYKMCYHLLEPLVSRYEQSAIYLDHKDTWGYRRTETLRRIFGRTQHFDRLQTINSADSALMQLADILIGAVNYRARMLKGVQLPSNAGKIRVITFLNDKTGTDIAMMTGRNAQKFNVFRWHARAVA